MRSAPQLSNVFVVNQRRYVVRVLRAGRLERHRPADAEPRAALRLHDAGHGGGQPHGELRSRQPASWCYADRRVARGSRARQARPQQLRAAPRRRLQGRTSATIIRGGYGIFYNQFDRIGSEDQLALNPPGLRNIDVSRDGDHATPVLLTAGRLPGQLPRSVEHRAQPPAAPRGATATARTRWCSSSAAASSGSSARSFVVSADVVGSSARNIAVLRNLNQPRQRQRRAARIRTSAHPVARDDGEPPTTRASICRSRSVSATATAIGSRTRSAKRAIRRPSTSTPRRAGRRTRATSTRGKARATSTSVIASSATSSSNCRSARASRCCGRRRPPSSAAGW